MTDKDRYRMGVEVSATVNSAARAKTPETSPDTPFCIAVLGDFSGRENNRVYAPETIASRRLIAVDRDNFEDVMASFDISLKINPQDSDAVSLKLKELDDFQPDQVYEKLETFSKLRSLRRRLKNKNSFAEAAAEMQGWLPAHEPAKAVGAGAIDATVENNTPTANLLDNILSGVKQAQGNNTSASAIDQLINKINKRL